MEEHLPRRLAAIFYADVADYSRHTGQDEDSTHRCLSKCLDLVTGIVKAHRGEINHYAGDAILARIDAAIDAVHASVEAQQQIKACNQDLPEERRLQIRIGLNLGDVIEDRGDIYGDGVNVAARLESLADAGGICISDSIRTAIGTQLNLDYEDLGEQSVKNIADPVHAYRISMVDNQAIQAMPATDFEQGTDRPSIVVLPFKNRGGDEESDYFVEGMTEEIMTGLSRFREIMVVALGSSVLVNQQAESTVDAANRVGARFALEGGIQKSGSKIRITGKLIEAKTGEQIWAERFDRVLDDIFEVQDEVAQQIVSIIAGNIERSDRERSMRKDTWDLTAYECVLRGRKCFDDFHGSEEDIRCAQGMFQHAIDTDPRYAAAYAGLAATYMMQYDKGWTDRRQDTGERCIELALKAVELDPSDSFPHLILSHAYWHIKGNFELAKSQIETAIDLNPNYYWNYCYGCWFSMCTGSVETSITQGNEAIRRNPLLPEGCLGNIGLSEYLSGQYENAISTIGKIADLDPEYYACLSACYGQLGQNDKAGPLIDEFRNIRGTDVMSYNEWCEFWKVERKIADQASIDHLIEGLVKVGMVSG